MIITWSLDIGDAAADQPAIHFLETLDPNTWRYTEQSAEIIHFDNDADALMFMLLASGAGVVPQVT